MLSTFDKLPVTWVITARDLESPGGEVRCSLAAAPIVGKGDTITTAPFSAMVNLAGISLRTGLLLDGQRLLYPKHANRIFSIGGVKSDSSSVLIPFHCAFVSLLLLNF